MATTSGDRTIVSNATGCYYIFGGNLPTTPYTKNKQGRGPAWSNSLFEDNAEFGLGIRLAQEKQTDYAHALLHSLVQVAGEELVREILAAVQSNERGIHKHRHLVARLD